MARVPAGILGSLIGKAGPVSGYMRNGQNIIRTAAKRKDPKVTPLRSAQRIKITLVNEFTKAFTGSGFFNKTFPSSGAKGSGHNRATSALLNFAVAGEYPHTKINWPDALISKGNLPTAIHASAIKIGDNEILFTWQDNSGTGTAKETDQVVLVIYFPETKKAAFQIGTGTRKDGSSIFVLKDEIRTPGETWIGFISQDEKEASNSVWTGRIV